MSRVSSKPGLIGFDHLGGLLMWNSSGTSLQVGTHHECSRDLDEKSCQMQVHHMVFKENENTAPSEAIGPFYSLC